MSIEEWKTFYLVNFAWRSVVDGDKLYLITGSGPKLSALEICHQQETFDRVIESCVNTHHIPRVDMETVSAEIDGHKVYFFQMHGDIQYRTLPTKRQFLTYNGIGPLYWNFHNEGGMVPVEPTPGCKWPVPKDQLMSYINTKLQNWSATDMVMSMIRNGEVWEGLGGPQGPWCEFEHAQLMTKYKKEWYELGRYPKVKILSKFLDRTQSHHYHDILKLGLSPTQSQINDLIVNNIALIDHGCYWVVRMYDPEMKILDFTIMRDDAARAMFKNAKFAAPVGKKRQPNLLEFIEKAEVINRIKFGKMNFNPCPDIADFYYRNENAVFNLFHGFKHVHTGQFDMARVSRVLDHFKAIYAPDNEHLFNYLIRWMAWIVQKPNQKTMVCLVIRSLEGAGKTSWFDWFGNQVIGQGYYLKSIFEKIMGKFNGPLMGKLLTVINEVGNGELYGVHNKFKEMITDETIPIEKKNQDVITVNDFNNYVVCTNDDYPVKITPNDRRYCCIDGNSVFIGKHDYWNMCYKEILTPENGADFYNYLMTIDISQSHPKNIPMTKARREMKIDSQPPPIKYLISLARNWEADIDIDTDEMYRNIIRWKEQEGINHNFTRDYCLKLVNKVVPSDRVMRNGARSTRYVFGRELLIQGLNRFLNEDIRDLVD